jgi:uncharacterized protein YjbI with pentapeptide repeats
MTVSAPLSGRRKLSAGEIEMILTAHDKLISGRPGGKRASLKFIDLTKVRLAGRNLAEADLSGSVLDGADLSNCNLERANLFGCDLRNANLRHAKLARADMRGVCLRGANLSQADLTQTDFRVGQIAIPHPSKGLASMSHEARNGELDNANFRGATLDGSRFNDASLFACDFTDCSLKGATLTGANLKDANLSGAILDGADVSGANLSGANFSYASISGVAMERARTSEGAILSGALVAPSDSAVGRMKDLLLMAKSNAIWCQTGGKDGRPAQFDREDLRPLGKLLTGLRLTAMSAKAAVMVGIDLSGVHLQGANLEGAKRHLEILEFLLEHLWREQLLIGQFKR